MKLGFNAQNCSEHRPVGGYTGSGSENLIASTLPNFSVVVTIDVATKLNSLRWGQSNLCETRLAMKAVVVRDVDSYQTGEGTWRRKGTRQREGRWQGE